MARAGVERVVLCGASEAAKIVIGLVEGNGIRVVGVLDERYADEMFNGVPMWRAEELPEGEWDGVLITALEDLDTVEAQLREMGLSEERIWRLS